ncbi:MAG: transketolase C-terminal domain-containing protein [bacterium]
MNLNPKIFDKDVEQVPIRKGFGEGLVLAAEKNKNVVGLCADLTESTMMHLFKNKFPERFVEIGVAEQNLASVASGMSAMGKIPFISSYAMFSPGRNWEQIRTTICYNDRKVIIAGSHAGVSVGPDGGTHQAVEDIAITRVIPNITIISPCDAIEAKKATLACLDVKTPVYLRLAREKTPVITTDETPFIVGKAQIFYEANKALLKKERIDVGIIATGSLVFKAIMVARNLEKKGIAANVLNLSTIKPLDTEAILNLAKEAGAIVTVEEHQIAGGMGSAVAEFLAGSFPVPIEFIGVQNKFGQSGTPDELIEHYGMGETHIMKAVERVVGRK